jgi:hypothetical protein
VGHAIVAEVAEDSLTPTARMQVDQLLTLEQHQHLDEIASWADAYRLSHPETAKWHFVDIPLNADGYDAQRDCPEDNCVVAQIPRFAGILGDRSRAPPDRLQALKFLVHFVGDIFQPLHCADKGDRGGNEVRLTFAGHRTNLHAIWDGGILDDELHTRPGPDFAPDLVVTRGFHTAAQRAAALAPPLLPRLGQAVVDWANRSHLQARSAYAWLPADHARGWETAYEAEAWGMMQSDLQTAGTVLGQLLNETLS